MSGPEDLSKLTNEQLQALLAAGAAVQPTDAKTGEALPPQQAQTYRQLGAAGGIDPQAVPGSPRLPLAQRSPEDLPEQGQYYVDTQGRVQHMPASDVGDAHRAVMDRVRSFARGIPVLGAGLDEADAASAALVAPLAEPLLKRLPAGLQGAMGYDPRLDVGDAGDFGDRYNAALNLQRLTDQSFDSANPKTSGGLQLAGALGGTLAGMRALAPISSALPAESGMFTRMGAGAAEGAALGGAQGYLSGDGSLTDPSRQQSAMMGGMTGGGLGGAFPLAARVAGSAWKPTGGRLVDALRQSIQDTKQLPGPNVKALADLTGGQPGMPAALAEGRDRDLADILATIQAAPKAPRVPPSAMDDALARIARAGERQGQTPDDLARVIAELGPRAILADSGQAVRDLTKSAMNTPSGAEGIARANLNLRQEGVRDGGNYLARPSSTRIADEAAGGMGIGDKGYDSTLEALAKVKKEAADPLYAQVREIGATHSPKLAALEGRPSVQRAIKRAYEIAKEEGRNPEDLAIVSVESPENWVSSLPPEDQAVLQARGAVLKRGGTVKPSQGPSLAKFIADGGGIVDDGGELAAMGADKWHAGKPYQRSLLGKPAPAAGLPGTPKPYQPGGAPADDWALRAWEAGYFPQWAERPTTRQLYDALANEMRGKPTYARSLSEKLTDRLNMRDQAEEVIARGGAEPPPSPEDYTGRPAPVDEPAYEAQPTAETWDLVKRALDDELVPYYEGKKAWDSKARATQRTLEDLRGELRRINPVYGEALDAWSGPTAMQDAMSEGRRAFNESGEALQRKFSDFTPAEREMYRVGAVQSLRDKLGNIDVTFNAAQRAGVLKPAQLARFKELFPRESAFNDFVKTLDRESQMYGTRTDLIRQSSTAKQLEHAAEGPADPLESAVDTAVSIKTGGTAGLVRALKEWSTGKLDPKAAEAIASITTSLDQTQIPQVVERMKSARSSAALAAGLRQYLQTSGVVAGSRAMTEARN